MKKIKLLCASISVFVLCLGFINCVSAASIYTVSVKSGLHQYGGGNQYYKVNAECRDLGSSRFMDSWTSSWHHYGSDSVWYSHDNVKVTSSGTNYKWYQGVSTIDLVNSATLKKKLTY